MKTEIELGTKEIEIACLEYIKRRIPSFKESSLRLSALNLDKPDRTGFPTYYFCFRTTGNSLLPMEPLPNGQ